ncbi:YiaA/YiaB family inner membrane protein [Yinghuangia aomiensis]
MQANGSPVRRLAMAAIGTQHRLHLPVASAWIRGFVALGGLYLVTSSFTLAKVIRDRQETETMVNRRRPGRLEKLAFRSRPLPARVGVTRGARGAMAAPASGAARRRDRRVAYRRPVPAAAHDHSARTCRRGPGPPGITGAVRELPQDVPTAAAAAEALGCEVGAIANSPRLQRRRRAAPGPDQRRTRSTPSAWRA